MAASNMTLYVYDHCPYCVIARCVFGLKKLDFELKTIPNADEATPIGLIGKKMVPILVKPDGTAMAESMDIVRWVDANFGERMVQPASGRADIADWISSTSPLLRILLFPRWARAPLIEFEDDASKAYFTAKKEAVIGCSFAEALAKTLEMLEHLNPKMEELSNIIQSEKGIHGEDFVSEDDIAVFGRLRGMTLIKELVWPAKVRAYLEHMAAKLNIDLYDAYAQDA